MRYLLLLGLIGPVVASATPNPSKPFIDHAPWSQFQSSEGRRKPDQTGVYDLERITTRLSIDEGGLPTTVSHTVILTTQAHIQGAIGFYAPDFFPQTVRITNDLNQMIGTNTFRDPDTGDFFISLDEDVAADSRLTIHMTGRIDYEQMCTAPVACVTEGPYLHVATAGWYPMSNEYPTTDRFHFEAHLTSEGPLTPLGIGLRVNDDPRTSHFATETVTFLPLITAGQYQAVEAPGGITFYAPADVNEVFIEAVAARSVSVYETLFGAFPYSQLRLTAISDAASAGIGAQSQVLLPDALWRVPPDDSFFRTVRQVVAHEVAHQYFFNLIGITDAEEGWMSEGFAEYAATRVSADIEGNDAHLRRNYWSYMTSVPAEGDAPLQGIAVRMSPHSFEIIYNKGSAVLGAIRALLGEATFDDTMQAYVSTFAGEITTTQEFERFLMERTGHEGIPSFFEHWVYGKGYPTLEVEVQRADLDSRRVTLEIRQVLPPGRALPFSGQLPIQIRGNDTLEERVLVLEAERHEINLAEGQWISVDPGFSLFRRIRPTPAGDVNLTGVVDGMDLLDLNHALGRQIPDVQFRDALDVNNDGAITPLDLDALLAQFGRGWRP